MSKLHPVSARLNAPLARVLPLLGVPASLLRTICFQTGILGTLRVSGPRRECKDAEALWEERGAQQQMS